MNFVTSISSPFQAHIFIVPFLISSPISMLAELFPYEKAGNSQEYIPCSENAFPEGIPSDFNTFIVQIH